METAVISDLIRTLLARRNVTSDEDIAAFLAPDYVAHTHDPFLMRDMHKAVDRIFAAIEKSERIAVYADFDCDGIPGASILSDFFNKIGYSNFEIYLPHRDREGYGFHTSAIDVLASSGVSLIITVDVGTVAYEGIAHAREKGIDVIVTDHHEIPPGGGQASAEPEAFALLNPKIAPYPFPDLCGAGVAFKLVCALLVEGRRRNMNAFSSIPEGWEKWLLDLVAIATVADMVPLVGENRALAYWGMRVLRKSKRAGIIALCNRVRLKRSEITEDDIGFSIAPRINAASRMDEPDLALTLLTTHSEIEADQIAARLEELNASRKGIVSGIVRAARKSVHERYNDADRVVVLGNTEWKPALLGLAANSIMGDRGGVVCLWGRDANGVLKGSCRSDGAIALPDLFASARDAFIECGGHNASGGFSVSHEKVHLLREALQAAAASVPHATGQAPARSDDAVITLNEISWPLLGEVARLAPFGIGNPKPVFKIARAQIASVRSFGKEKNHIEVILTDSAGAASMRAFDFFRRIDDFTHQPRERETAAVLATLERDSFRSPARLALRLVDITSS